MARWSPKRWATSRVSICWRKLSLPRGYRLLNRISRLPQPVIENLVEHFGILTNILAASVDDLDEVEGVGTVRARVIRDGLNRIQEQVLIDRHL